ncbi:MAG: TrkH family potassium uptake protein [Bacteroidales bacterium]|nr:TrkH family potassium uptake protein [Bacteroidales bacterium]
MAHRNKLINIKMVIKVMGFLLMIEAAFMLTSLVFAFYYHESPVPIAVSAAITLVTGVLLWVFSLRKAPKNIGKREGFLIVTLTWLVSSLFGALPYLFSGAIPSFTNAFFETMSGFTTTGASILNDIELLPKYILFWRSMTHWMGGMGIIVLTVAILPFLGVGGMQLFVAEMPGITPDKLHPRVTATARRFWGIYVILTAAEVLLLWLGGSMNFFDAVCHSFATMATGGFSTKNNSIVGFTPYDQYVIIVFMLLAGTNFTLHYFSMHGQIRKVIKNEEFRVYLLIVAIFTVGITLGLMNYNAQSGEPAFRDALFAVSSILTTTGFVTANYLIWPAHLWLMIFGLMFIGGMAGSTGGGVKIIRHILLFKNSRLELKRSLHPNALIPVKYDGRTVSQQIIFNVMAFFLLYLFLFVIGIFLLTLLGLDLQTSMGASIASLGNIGPGIGGVGPVENYAFIPDAGKWILSFLMLMGRLELFTVLVVLSPSFWK